MKAHNHHRITPRIESVACAFKSRRCLTSHVCALVGGVGLSFSFAYGNGYSSLWAAGILLVYAVWSISSLFLTRRDGGNADEVVCRDGFTYLPFILIPFCHFLNIRYFTLSVNEGAARSLALTLVIVLKSLTATRGWSTVVPASIRRRDPWPAVTTVCAVMYAFLFARLSCWEFHSLSGSSSAFDLAHYDQAAWNTVHGRLLEFTYSDPTTGVQMNRLGLHADIIHLLFSLFYLIYSSPVTLLVLQSTVIAGASWPLYAFTRKGTGSGFISFAVCAAFLLNPAIQYGNLSQFHAVCAAPLCIFALLHFLTTKRWSGYWTALLLTLACKESLSLTTFAIGIWAITQGERRRGGWTCVLSIFWFFFCVKLVMPHFWGGKQVLYMDMMFKEAGGSLSSIALRFLRTPAAAFSFMFTPPKLGYLDDLLASVGYLPILAPPLALLAIPELSINLLSQAPLMHTMSEHYNFVTVPLLLIASVYAIRMAQRVLSAWGSSNSEILHEVTHFAAHPHESPTSTPPTTTGRTHLPNVSVALGLYVIGQSISVSHARSPVPWSSVYLVRVFAPMSHHSLVGERIMHQIPSDASVSANYHLMAHLSQRRSVYSLPYVGDADYILSDVSDVPNQESTHNKELDYLSRLHRNTQYRLVAAADGFFLWQRKPYTRPDRIPVSFDFRRDFEVLGQADLLSDAAVASGLRALRKLRPKGLRVGDARDITGGQYLPRAPSLVVIDSSDANDLPGVYSTLRLWEKDLVPQSSEGYIVRTRIVANQPCMIVLSPSRLGLAFALHRIAFKLESDPTAWSQAWDMTRSPALKLRLMSTPFTVNKYYNDPETALRYGFNTIMVADWPGLVTYRDFDHRIHGGYRNRDSGRWVLAQREEARRVIRVARSFHLKVATMGDVFSFPRSVFDLYGSQLGHQPAGRHDDYTVCAGRKLPWQLLVTSLRELLHDFPEVDYVIVRTGENYPSPYLVGSPPVYNRCAYCRSLNYVETLDKTINLARHEVVDCFHRQYIHRAWDVGTTGFHANTGIHDAVLNGLESQDGLIISLKHSQTDFWRYNPLNLNIGRGSVPQIIEFQCAREYEGKGAFPNYLANLYAWGAPETRPRRGLLYATSLGVLGGWAWAKGGGWGGPYLKTNIWVDANIHAISRLMWDPFLSPREIAYEWTSATFGSEAAPTATEILLRSQDAVVHSRYFSPLAGRTSVWMPGLNWTRDDIIKGMSTLASVYEKCSSQMDFDTVVMEQQEAVRQVDSSVEKFRRILKSIPDRQIAAQAYQTLLYQQSLYRVRRNYVCGTFYYLAWGKSGGRDQEAGLGARHYLTQWSKEWVRFQTVIAALPWAASPYHSAGMADDCNYALSMLKNPPPAGVRWRDLIPSKT